MFNGGTEIRARVAVTFAYGFRPFFLLAGLAAIFNMALWLAVYFLPGLWPDTAIAPVYWHAHEMLFGFVAAAIGGFLLTAVPGWAGRKPYAGWPLGSLVAIWLVGRVVMMPWCTLSPVVTAIADLAFFPALALALAPPLLRAGKLRNLGFVPALLALFLANLCFHLGQLGAWEGAEHAGLSIGIDIVLLLITVVGGRIIPGFTRNGLVRHAITIQMTARPMLDGAAIAAMLAVLLTDVIAPQSQESGIVALIAAALQATRLAQWQGHRALREPLVWVLHAGYAWLVIGLLLKGLWLVADVSLAAKYIHAFTTGAFATMILAVMTRAALGHTGRTLVAPQGAVAAYVFVTLAAVIRVFGHWFAPTHYDTAIAFAGAFWISAFGLFVLSYGRILTTPRIDGKPG
ncbi:MAG TPA: NnrS family protein [Rhizomicrobium sp.]|nr:NnrS family protein [Rhizomicrobium sp.]